MSTGGDQQVPNEGRLRSTLSRLRRVCRPNECASTSSENPQPDGFRNLLGFWRSRAANADSLELAATPCPLPQEVILAKLRERKEPEMAINKVVMKNCEQTSIGTKVQMSEGGNLTINQFLINGNESQPIVNKAVKNQLIIDPKKRFSWRDAFRLKVMIPTVMIALVVAGIVVGTIYLTKNGPAPDTPPLSWEARFRDRASWGAVEPSPPFEPLTYQPARYVIVTDTKGVFCRNERSCAAVIKGLEQKYKKWRQDIRFNFFIGTDGLIYEGRGWNVQGDFETMFDCASVTVAVIGDFTVANFTSDLEAPLRLLIDKGLETNQIAASYSLTDETAFAKYPWKLKNNSLVRAIEKMDHFYRPGVKDYLCSTTVYHPSLCITDMFGRCL